MKEICKYEKECGGCQLLNTPYEEQLKSKTEITQKFLKETGAVVSPCVGCFYPYKYRNKIHLAFSRERGRVKIGFFEEESKNIVDIESCVLHDEWATKLIASLRKYIKLSKIDIFEQDSESGNLRYVVARYLDNTLMLTVVIYNKFIMGLNFLFDDLKKEFSDVGIYVNINQTKTSAVFSNQFFHKFGMKKQNAKMLGVHFQLMPQSFFQINQTIATKIYNQVFKMLEAEDNELILDLYSGIGISSLLFAKKCKKVVSIEIVPEAVQEAKRLAKENHISNISFFCGKCEEILPELIFEGNVTTFLDPPRRGCEEQVLNKILEIAPKTIIYLSCNPQSLASDLAILAPKYAATQIIPFDMFPQTRHVEVLCALFRR